MKIILDVKDNKAAFFMELLKNFTYVKAEPLIQNKTNLKKSLKMKNDQEFSDNERILNGIKQAVEEMKLIKAGKLKGKSARDLYNEL